MDTVRVDICYRPLRVGWAIRAGDVEAFRQAVRLNHTLWGGRFNPILVVDQDEEACRLVDLFRVDLILPLGESEEVNRFPKRFPHLINPFFGNEIFIGGAKEQKKAQLLDIHNTLLHIRDKPEWKATHEKGVRVYTWQAVDPLADAFLVQFGAYPRAEEIGIDYLDMLTKAAGATPCPIDPLVPLPADVLDYISIANLSRVSLERHHSVEPGWDTPGFFVGDVNSLDDLVCYWNLRAADIPLWFIDPAHLSRYATIIPLWEQYMREAVSHRQEFDRHVAVWSRRENIDEVRKPFGALDLWTYPVSMHSWNGRNVRPPLMHFDEVSTLGVVGIEGERLKVSFSLIEKPFCGDFWFHTQHLVASISFMGGLYGDGQHTLIPPFIPELNEFYARAMTVLYNKLRIESGRIGLIIDALDKDCFVYALPVSDLFEKVFDMGGFSAKPSAGGLVARQLIAQLGGIQGGRVFKMPGVRRLIRTHRPTDAFTKNKALQLIGGKDPTNPTAKFEDHEQLYIQTRQGGKLTPQEVFSYLVEKRLFRIGAELTCPTCRMPSWTALDALRQRLTCELCGHEYDATRQLVEGKWHYRRSGVLGAEKSAQGAVPVVLTLQQLETALDMGFNRGIYSSSIDLRPKDGAKVPKCEIDFVWLIPRPYPRKTVVILGECKDQGPIKPNDFERDIENLRLVADALPRKRFKTFLLLAKLSAFTPEEIEYARTLNNKYQARAILLTARELEPYDIYERTKQEFHIKGYGNTPEDLAQMTAEMYFKKEPDQGGS